LLPRIIFLAVFSLAGNVFAEQTIKYMGTVYASPMKHLMPLGNGDGVLITQAAGIAAMSDASGMPPAIFAINCAGMGIEKPDETAVSDFYCNLKEDDEDSFDIKGIVASSAEENKFDVIGGSGKWKGASGKGAFARVFESEEGNKNVFVVEITTP